MKIVKGQIYEHVLDSKIKRIVLGVGRTHVHIDQQGQEALISIRSIEDNHKLVGFKDSGHKPISRHARFILLTILRWCETDGDLANTVVAERNKDLRECRTLKSHLQQLIVQDRIDRRNKNIRRG